MKKMLAVLIGSCLSMSAFAQVIQAGKSCAQAPTYQVTVSVSMPDTNYYVTITNNQANTQGKPLTSTNKTTSSFTILIGSTYECFDWIAVHN